MQGDAGRKVAAGRFGNFGKGLGVVVEVLQECVANPANGVRIEAQLAAQGFDGRHIGQRGHGDIVLSAEASFQGAKQPQRARAREGEPEGVAITK